MPGLTHLCLCWPSRLPCPEINGSGLSLQCLSQPPSPFSCLGSIKFTHICSLATSMELPFLRRAPPWCQIVRNHFRRKASTPSFKHEILQPSLSLVCVQSTSVFCPIQSKGKGINILVVVRYRCKCRNRLRCRYGCRCSYRCRGVYRNR